MQGASEIMRVLSVFLKSLPLQERQKDVITQMAVRCMRGGHRKSGMRGRLSRTRTVGMVRRTRILRFICILRVHTTHKGSMRAR